MSATTIPEVVAEVRRLPKTMRWWDAVVLLGLANPGFYLTGIAFSVVALGPLWAIVLWVASAALGAVQAVVYSETAAMFPDKPGGLSVHAREGWRGRFSLAGPLAVAGYWLSWTTALAVFGGVIGLLFVSEFLPGTAAATWSWTMPGTGWDVTTARLIGLGCIVAAYLASRRGQSLALRWGRGLGALIAVPLAVIAIGPFLTGDVANHSLTGSNMTATLDFYGWSTGFWGKLVLVMAWLYILAYSTYGAGCTATFAPEYKDTKNDTRKAILAVGAINLAFAVLLPIAIAGTLGVDALAKDTSGVVYLIAVLHTIVGEAAGTVLVALLCAGLLLLMQTGTMASSRALYALGGEGMTIRWLGRLNRHGVPERAMALGLALNAWLLFQFPSVFFILAVGNLGFLLAHVLALSGYLLLRRDRPHWPRPIRLGPVWTVVAAVACLANLAFIVFGLIGLRLTGYAFDAAMTNPTAWLGRIVLVGVSTLILGCAGYAVAQHQQGKRFSLTDPSDEEPSAEAIAALQR
ncbi:MAG TPA: APC family permease [Sporichthyaceae bacterium]|nr:APC family permease [Sporichthyaceae bacterium]